MEGKMNIRKATAEDLDTIWIRKGATGRSPLLLLPHFFFL